MVLSPIVLNKGNALILLSCCKFLNLLCRCSCKINKMKTLVFTPTQFKKPWHNYAHILRKSCTPMLYCELRFHVELQLFVTRKSSCDNVAVSDFFNILIFLGDGYDSIGSLQWCSSRSDSLTLCFGHFPTSYMKITV